MTTDRRGDRAATESAVPSVLTMPVAIVGAVRSFNLRDGRNVSEWDREYRAGRQHPYYAELDEDVRLNGVREPVEIVRSLDGIPTLWEGHHRYSAAVRAGQPEIPVTGSGVGLLTCTTAEEPCRGLRDRVGRG